MNEDTRKLLEDTRRERHELVDRAIDSLYGIRQEVTVDEKENILLFSTYPAFFKSKKPVSVLFPDGREVMTKTWKQVAVTLLQDCNSDELMHKHLSEISGKVFGRDRTIIGKDTTGMVAPLRVDDGIYFESKFDTESLLKVLMERVLNVVGYDYTGIYIKLKEPQKLDLTIEQKQQKKKIHQQCRCRAERNGYGEKTY